MTEPRWRTVPDLVADAAHRFADLPAVVDGPMRLSFDELGEEVARAARAARAAGVGTGERAAVWAPNCWEWAVAALGVLSAGAALVPLNTRYRGVEAVDILRRSRARLLFTVRGFLGTDYVELLRSAGEAPDLATTVLLRGDPVPGVAGWGEFLAAGEADHGEHAPVEPDDVSDVIYTSGTTGRPKGVMATHAQTVRVYDTWSEVVGLARGDRYLVVNPFFHTFGYKAGLLACLMRGATVIPEPVFDPVRVMARIQEHAVTVLPGPPTLYQSLLDHPDRSGFDLSSLRLVVTGAAVVPVQLVQRLRDELGVQTVLTAYGLTEATGTVSMCRRDDDVQTVAATSGRPIPGVEVRVVDRAGAAAAPGAPGEILVRGYNVMRGYLDDPEATAAAVDPDGWLHTGDVGVLDDRGYLKVTDRIKDMFIVGGFNAYPAEIEQALAEHPDVAEAAVIGVADDRLGEVGAAFVVPAPGRTADSAALSAWARDRMANFKVPRRIVVVAELPRNASGKVLKGELRRQMSMDGPA